MANFFFYCTEDLVLLGIFLQCEESHLTAAGALVYGNTPLFRLLNFISAFVRLETESRSFCTLAGWVLWPFHSPLRVLRPFLYLVSSVFICEIPRHSSSFYLFCTAFTNPTIFLDYCFLKFGKLLIYYFSKYFIVLSFHLLCSYHMWVCVYVCVLFFTDLQILPLSHLPLPLSHLLPCSLS